MAFFLGHTVVLRHVNVRESAFVKEFQAKAYSVFQPINQMQHGVSIHAHIDSHHVR